MGSVRSGALWGAAVWLSYALVECWICTLYRVSSLHLGVVDLVHWKLLAAAVTGYLVLGALAGAAFAAVSRSPRLGACLSLLVANALNVITEPPLTPPHKAVLLMCATLS